MTIKNESGLHPRGVAVLTKPFEAKKMSAIIHVPESYVDYLERLENRVIVVEVGPSAWHEENGPRAKIGDAVFVTKHAGFQALGADGKMYRLVNDRDIFCVIDLALFEAEKEARA